VTREELEVNGKSIMGVMMLAAECGSTLQLKAEGPDAKEALDALEQLIGSKFGES
jgi:phosphocarrier protein